MNKVNLISGVVFLVSVVFLGVLFIKSGVVKKDTVMEAIDNVSPTPSPVYVYRNSISGYELTVPSSWGISESQNDPNFESRAVIKSGDTNLKVSEITVSVVPFGKKNMPLSTIKEFEEIFKAIDGASVSGFKKLGSLDISGNRTVLVLDNSDGGWVALAWFFKDEKNYYINMIGKEEFVKDDENVFRYLLATFELK